MALDVNAIKGYVDENEAVLIGETLIKGKTASLLNLQTGVKGSEYLNLLSADPTLQAGGCGWNSDGDTTVTRRKLETGQIKVNQTFCDKDLIGTYMQHNVKIAAGAKTLPFEQEFIAQNLNAIQKKLEEIIWQGDTKDGVAHLKRFDGFIKILDAASGVVDATHSEAKDVVTDAKEVIESVLAGIPNEIMDRTDKAILVGYDVYRAYVAQLQAANLFHYTNDLTGAMEMVIPGTDVKLIGVAGLVGTKRVYATYLENMYLGTDLEGDYEKFKFWYSEDNAEFRLKVEFNAGVQVAFPNMIVEYKGA